MKGAGTLADGFTGLMVIDDPLDGFDGVKRIELTGKLSS